MTGQMNGTPVASERRGCSICGNPINAGVHRTGENEAPDLCIDCLEEGREIYEQATGKKWGSK